MKRVKLKEIKSVSLKNPSKRVEDVENKMGVLDIQELLLLYIIGKNLQFK